MIPQGGRMTAASVQEAVQPSLTWRLDLDKGYVTGKVDGLDAIKQAVFKIVQTDRFWYDVYSFDYGLELVSLIGKEPLYVRSEVSRMLNEALMQDDRIQSVDGINVEMDGDQLTVQFVVVTQYGSFEGEVTRSV